MMLALLVLSVLPAVPIQDKPAFVVPGCTEPAVVTLENIDLPIALMANGKPLAPGRYTLRITAEHPTPAAGQSVACECWVEFLQKGVVAAREVASVIPADEIKDIAKGPVPAPGTARVDLLKERDYVRVWMNGGGTHYLVNLTIAR